MMRTPNRIVRPRTGMALVSALVSLVLISIIIAGVFALTISESKASTNRANALRATQLAEAGMTHAVGVLRGQLADTGFTRLLRGSDGTASTADDGYISGYGLAAALQIADTGRTTTWGRYFVQLIDDPADGDGIATTDANNRIVARCRAVTTDGAIAEVDAIIAVSPFPAVVVDGPLTLNGNPELVGACGGAHSNSTIDVSGTTTVTTAGLLTSTGATTVSGNIMDTAGVSIPPVPNQPPMDIPDLDPASYCAAAADYYLQADGFVLRVSDNSLHDATSVEKFGFRRASSSPVVWDQAGADPAGTYCATGNVKIGSNIGSSGSPAVITILATGSIEVSGNPYMVPDYGGISLMAAGDVSISGNPSAGADNYSGLVYAGAQCKVSGNLHLSGQLVCKNKANPTGSLDYASQNAISGNASITYNCGSSTVLGNRRVLYWYPRIGG